MPLGRCREAGIGVVFVPVEDDKEALEFYRSLKELNRQSAPSFGSDDSGAPLYDPSSRCGTLNDDRK